MRTPALSQSRTRQSDSEVSTTRSAEGSAPAREPAPAPKLQLPTANQLRSQGRYATTTATAAHQRSPPEMIQQRQAQPAEPSRGPEPCESISDRLSQPPPRTPAKAVATRQPDRQLP